MQEKLSKYDAPQKAKALGVYPYFRKIESDQDTEVLINGKKVLMSVRTVILGIPITQKLKMLDMPDYGNLVRVVPVPDS